MNQTPPFRLFSECATDIVRYFSFSLLILAVYVYAVAQPSEQVKKLSGKWSGKIQSEMKAFGTKGEIIGRGKCSVEIIDISVQEYEEREPSAEEKELAKLSGFAPILTSFSGWARFSALTEFFSKEGITQRWSLPNNQEIIRVDGHFLIDNTFFIDSDDDIAMKQEQWLPAPLGYTVYEYTDWPAFSMGGSPLFPTRAVMFNLKDGEIKIDDIWKDGGEIKVTGELFRTELLIKNFPRDIKPNEPIQTDNKTRIEVTLLDVGKVNLAQNTHAILRSGNLMEVTKGIIHGVISRLKPKSKFDVHTPTSIIGIRGTEFTLDVANDGTTTLMVISGDVEICDKLNRGTVIVKSGQQSLVKPNGLPSKPISVKTKRIPKWSE